MTRSGDDEPVPRLPRTAGFKISMAAVVRIALTAAMLAMIIVARRPCADSVSSFVTNFDNTGSGSAAVQMPKPGTVDVPASTGSAGDYETLRSDMTEAEIKAAIERARAKSRGSAGSNGRADGSADRNATDGSAGRGSNGAGSGSAGSASNPMVGSDAR